MCLAVPCKIVELNGAQAVVEMTGVRRECNVAFIPDPKLGDHVLMHAGFAIQKWSEAEVQEYNQIVGEYFQQP